MQASECCIIRASIAACLGALIAFVLLLNDGVLTALVLSPFVGSATAVGPVTLFWFVSLFIPCPPAGQRDAEAARS